MTQPPYQYGPQPPWGQPYPVPPPKKSPVIFIVIAVVVLLLGAAGVLGTGLLWPGWMKQTSSAPVDQSTPEATAKAVEDALNRRDVDQFVQVLVCKDGRTQAKNKNITQAEEILYRDIKPFDPKSKSDVQPTFKVDVWARLDAEVVRATTAAGLGWLALSGCTTSLDHHYVYPKDSGLSKQRGVLAMFQEDNKYVVCEMGFIPVADTQEPPPDPDPASATGRMQAFAKAVNDKDIAAARRYMCATARAVNTWAEKAIAAGGKLRLHDKVTTTKAEDSGQVRMWYTLNGAETKAGGFLKKESDGWCIFSFNNDTK